MTEPCIHQLQFVLLGSKWIVRKAEHLSAILYSLGVAMVLRGLTMSKDARHVVSLSPVGIPRFVT